MLVLLISHVKNIETKIENTYCEYWKSALFSTKFGAKIMWILAILRVENIKIKIENI
jgi:hypothetical protein